MKPHRKINNRRKSLKIPTPIVYIFLIALGLYFFIHSPAFGVKEIKVTGNSLLAEEKVVSLSQINLGENIMKIKKDEVIKKISTHPFIKDVEVKRHLPTTLGIYVVERKPVGLLVCEDGFIQVCEEGYFLALVHDISEYMLPVISGIDLEQLPGPGQQIKNKELNLAIGIIKESPSLLMENMVEINIENQGYILAYTTDGIEIRLGSLEKIAEKLVYLEQILADFTKKGVNAKNIEYLDFRFSGPPVIKRK